MGFKLTRESFQKQDLGYWSYLNQNFELCLEPCLNGFDVAIYDHDKDLLEDKICLDIPNRYQDDFYGGERDDETWEKAIEVANKLIKRYL